VLFCSVVIILAFVPIRYLLTLDKEFNADSKVNLLSITGNGDSAKMELKVTNDNGKPNRVSGFQLTADNVLSTEIDDKVTVKDSVDYTKAVTTDARDNQKAIGITSNGAIDLTGYAQGIYTLDVVVDDDRAYEAIIAIGDQTNQIVDKEITRVNSDYTLKFIIDYDCGKGYHYENGKCIPNDRSPVPPVPCPESDPNCIEPPITPPITPEPEPITPEPEPITPEPEYPVDPCTTDLTSPDCQNLEEPVVLPLVGENTVEIPNEPVEDELFEEEETGEAEQEQNEGFTGEEEEVEEESSEEEESGESEGEDSGEESEGESEEDSAFGN
jgi:hypothetical protein